MSQSVSAAPAGTRPVKTGVPRECFVTPEWHQRDLEAVFRPRWHYAAHVSERAAPGSFVTFALGDDEVVITRSAVGELVAYHNFCRHRGHPLVTAERGTLQRTFVCGYHGWTYSKDDGSCLAATRMNEDFDRSQWGLHRAWVEELHGLVFVSLADRRPVSVADATRHIVTPEDGLRGWDLDRMKLAARAELEIAANWKVVVENDDECYHCALNHPELVRTYDPWSGFTVVEDLDRPQHLWTEDEWSVVDLGSNTYSDDPVCRVPLPRTHGDEGEDVMTVQFFWAPSGHLAFTPEYAWLWSVKPLGPERTLLTQHWLVSEDAREGEDYEVEPLTSFFDTTMRQDEVLCARIQRGFRMGRFTPGPLNPHHQAPAIAFYAWYEGCLAAAGR